jgi:hypothetical protein
MDLEPRFTNLCRRKRAIPLADNANRAGKMRTDAAWIESKRGPRGIEWPPRSRYGSGVTLRSNPRGYTDAGERRMRSNSPNTEKRERPLGVYGWVRSHYGGQPDRNPAEGGLSRW